MIINEGLAQKKHGKVKDMMMKLRFFFFLGMN